MSVLEADATLKKYLAPLRERTEIRDDQGNLLGVFVPQLGAKVLDEQSLRARFDPEELRRRKLASRGDLGRKLDEILQQFS